MQIASPLADFCSGRSVVEEVNALLNFICTFTSLCLSCFFELPVSSFVLVIRLPSNKALSLYSFSSTTCAFSFLFYILQLKASSIILSDWYSDAFEFLD